MVSRAIVDNGDGTHSVQLTKGYWSVVDSADLALVSAYAWHAFDVRVRGAAYAVYAVRHGDGRAPVYMHRSILGEPDGLVVDHISGDGLDNRRSNLRPATHSQNLLNRGKTRRNTSGYKGVSWDKERELWCVEFKYNRVRYRIGRFADKVEAAMAYDDVARRVCPSFCRLNFPDVA